MEGAATSNGRPLTIIDKMYLKSQYYFITLPVG